MKLFINTAVLFFLLGYTIAPGQVSFKQATDIRPKTADIDPNTATVNVLVVFAAFKSDTLIPTEADDVMSAVSAFYDKMSLGNHHLNFSTARRPAPNAHLPYIADNPSSFYQADISRFNAKIGLLQKEIFEKAYNDDQSIFNGIDFVFFIPLGQIFIGYTGMGRLGWYNSAGFPTTVYAGPGATALWLETQDRNEWNIAHEYGHQVGLNHPPQNNAFRYYGWYALMHNQHSGQTGIPPLSLPQFVFNDLWVSAGDLVQVTQNIKGAEFPPFPDTHKAYYYIDADYNVFMMANYQGTSYDSLWSGKGMQVWHTQGYNVWDIEAAHGNWQSGTVGGTPAPDGPPDGTDLLDQPIAVYSGGQSDFFDDNTFPAFTCGTNPNTNLYPADTSTLYPYSSKYNDTMRVTPQKIPCRFAVTNIRKKDTTGTDAQTLVADLYINNWSGHITSSTTWSNDIHVSGDVIIDPGVTLTIRAGVTVSFSAGYDDAATGDYTSLPELIVQGTLSAVGSKTRTVTFTSDADSPQDGDWGGILVKTGGTATLSNYDYDYAIRPVTYE